MLNTQGEFPVWGTYRPSTIGRAIIAVSRNSPLGRGGMRRRLIRLLSLVHSGPIDTQLWDQNVRLFPDHNVSERKALMRPDWMDRTEYALLREKMKNPGSVFVDVGANAGLYSLHAALHAGRDSRILAIEPVSGLLGRLQFNLARAREAGDVDPSIQVFMACTAIGDRDGEALLSSGLDEGSRSLLTDNGRPVKLRRLAPLLDEHGIEQISVMKIDVEGYEDRVLPPYLAAVPEQRWPHLIIIEHAHRRNWSVDCLADCFNRGYRVVGTSKNNTLLERPN
jgi:FkbM family methyltransferase